MLRHLAKLSLDTWLLAMVVLAGLVYVGNTWSPSSAALSLRQFGVADDGLVLGAPRPLRSDEWAVVTPLTQAAVNVGLERWNTRSYYGEDLRTVCAIPLWDWGLVFKPSMWLYPAVNAAYAFSFHHFTVIALFLLGYMALFRRLGAGTAVAALLSGALFFTSFTQYWWTALGAGLAYYPWLLVLFLARGRLWLRVLAFYWLATCWLMSNFYPPLNISLGFVTAALLFAFAPERLRQPRVLLGFGIAGALACLTLLFYLQDWLTSTLNTVYPGQRRVGGGGFGLDRVLLTFLPSARYQNHESLVASINSCELSVVGGYYFLMVACFLRYRALGSAWRAGQLKPLRVLIPALLVMSAWLFLPVPSTAGMPLLWHLVPATRMAFAFGLLLLVTAFVLCAKVGLELRPLRVLVFGALVLGAWYQFKLVENGISLRGAWKDVAVVPAVVAVFALARLGHLTQPRLHAALLASSVAVGVLSFGLFNPVQRAWPLFNRPETAVSRWLDSEAAKSPDGTLALNGFAGATLNGWGYRSVSHVLVGPQVETFRAIFPELSPEQLNLLFNRYAHITLSNDPQPRLLQPDAVAVPQRAFNTGPDVERWIRTEAPAGLPAPPRQAGHVDSVEVEGKMVELRGWAPWNELNTEQGLVVRLGRSAQSASIETFPRTDVAAAHGDFRYLESGFIARIQLERPLLPAEEKDLAVCVLALDEAKDQAYQLDLPPGVPGCAQLQ